MDEADALDHLPRQTLLRGNSSNPNRVQPPSVPDLQNYHVMALVHKWCITCIHSQTR